MFITRNPPRGTTTRLMLHFNMKVSGIPEGAYSPRASLWLVHILVLLFDAGLYDLQRAPGQPSSSLTTLE